MDFSEGSQLFAGHFHALLDEMNASMLQFRKKRITGNEFSNIKDSFAELFHVYVIYVYVIYKYMVHYVFAVM